ncbi:MAG: hypothetical protein Tsb005_09130 [Gammaproteobacteria bacterium]
MATINGTDGKDKLKLTDIKEDLFIESGAGDDKVTLRDIKGNVTLDAGAGDDRVQAHDINGDVSIDSGSGVDQINLTDVDGLVDLVTGEGNDKLELRDIKGDINIATDDGDDRLHTRDTQGNVEIDTGLDNDRIHVNRHEGELFVDSGDGDDLIRIQRVKGDVNVVAGEGNDVVKLHDIDGDVFIDGGNGDNTIRVRAVEGSVNIETGAGNDHIVVHDIDGTSYVFAGDGDDIINGGNQDDILIGGDGNDIIRGRDGQDILRGEAGNDELRGGRDHDELWGGIGDDKLYGHKGNDTLNGEAGNDQLFGRDDDDTLTGGQGDDFIHGGRGNDTAVLSGARSDYIVTQLDKKHIQITDTIDGRDGTDVVTRVENFQFSDGNVTLAELLEPSDPEPEGPAIIAAGTYRLNNHPDGEAANPTYGLRLDELIDVTHKHDIFTFDFNKTPGTGVFLTYDDNAQTIRIEGTVYGGLDVGKQYDKQLSGYWKISFEYNNVNLVNNDDDLQVLNSSQTAGGFITRVDTGETFELFQKANDQGLAFQLGNEVNDQGHRDFEGISGWGWVNHSDPNVHIAASDFLFTLDPTPIGNDDNQAPVANNDGIFTTGVNTALSITFTDLLANDSDPDGDNLSVINAQNVLNGSVVLDSANQVIIFTPSSDFSGNAQFEYTISDGQGGTASAAVQINIGTTNIPPQANPDSYTITLGDNVAINAANGLLANDTDADNDNLSVNSLAITTALGASVIVNADGSFNYDSTTISGLESLGVNDIIPDTFEYVVSDGNGGSDTATVTFTINGINDNPVANTDNFVTAEDTLINLFFSDLLANDSDVDTNDSLSILGIQNIVGGSINLDAEDLRLTFIPEQNFNGTASFEYLLSDNNGGSAIGNVIINVTPVNDAPTADDSIFALLNENFAVGTVIGTASGFDIDDPNTPLNFSIVNGDPLNAFSIDPTTGLITLADDSNLNLDFDDGNPFVASFDVAISDGELSALQNVIVSLTPVNDNAPIAGADKDVTVFQSSFNGSFVDFATALDADLPRENLSFSFVSGNDNGGFNIDSVSGVITIANVNVLDLDPTDGTSFVASLGVLVTDGLFNDTQRITLNVLDPFNPQIFASNIVDGTENNDTLLSTLADDIFTGLGGNDIFDFGNGNLGNDVILDFSGALTGGNDVLQFAAGVSINQTTQTASGDSLLTLNTGTTIQLVGVLNSEIDFTHDFIFI